MTPALRPLIGIVSLVAASCGPAQFAAVPPAGVTAADSAARAAIVNERTINAATLPARSVGVTPFRVVSADTSLYVLGIGLADLLITDLSRSRQLNVVDRLRVDALLRELGLAQSGYVDTSAARRFGRLVGARRLVTGSLVTGRNQRARLDGRVGDVATGRVLATEATATSVDEILDLEKAFAFAVFDRLGVALAPAERALVEQRPTRSLAALLAYSRAVRAELLRDYRLARQEYQAAIRIDSGFSTARARLDRIPASSGAQGTADLGRVAALTTEGINPATTPQVTSAADPAFRQRLLTTITIIVKLP